jgi:UDP-N-acetylmuramate dehydrogenase
LLVEARSVDALTQSVRISLELDVPYRVLGSGANVLVSDAGVRGLIVLNRARSVSPIPGGIKAESGAALALVVRQCVRAGQAGLEWAVGIPGTVGGAVIGNAGANGGCIADRLLSATVLEPRGTVTEWPVERFVYGYRTSALKYQPPGAGPRMTVLSATLRLEPADPGVLESRVSCFLARRAATQPSGASCGSVFRNPPGDYAGRLIEAAGLKGSQFGEAQISPVHANFIINLGEANAASVKALIERAQEQVWSQFGVRLELEIELVGDW